MIKPPYFSKSRLNHKLDIFHGDYNQRLIFWQHFRTQLESQSDALNQITQLYSHCPLTHTKTNFFDRSTWPEAWHLIEKNDYNEVDRLLGMWYSCRLTDKFIHSEINLMQCVLSNSEIVDKKQNVFVLAVDQLHCVVAEHTVLSKKEFDNRYVSQYTYFNI